MDPETKIFYPAGKKDNISDNLNDPYKQEPRLKGLLMLTEIAISGWVANDEDWEKERQTRISK